MKKIKLLDIKQIPRLKVKKEPSALLRRFEF